MELTRLPGTTVETALAPGAADRQLTPMFSFGGLVLSQVCQLTGLEGYTIQNWIKRRFLTPPVKKKYTRCQLCRIMNINLLKDTFTLEQAATLLGYACGSLDDAAGDFIDDSQLYSYLVDCLATLSSSGSLDLSRAGETVQAVTAGNKDLRRGAEIRLWMVLEIMLAACQTQQNNRRALEMFRRLENM